MSDKEIPSPPLTFFCTRAEFHPCGSEKARWLAPRADYYRFQQMQYTRGLEPPSMEEWLAWHAQGYGFAAVTPLGIIASLGTILKHPEAEWEIAGVRSLESQQGKGGATAVCSFLTEISLKERERVLCRVSADNAPMIHILEKLGFRRESVSE